MNMERFNLKKLNGVEGKCCIEVSNRSTALEDFETEVKINIAWGIWVP
jgi:hypothetical protein